ncbi:hypothetical protein M408DRAFT_305754 [Serendipita vermifera MAFF 305830]|uniref:CHAT domain-containing protein n=1 Tax=Serendipita vermifera MAFF 305830 TaxID=933852 RepID=A0A0C3A8P0_SERVB|nr:hypothetical protein M408DRAFT_305754 [Serendipita vermifera MAFF 305830]
MVWSCIPEPSSLLKVPLLEYHEFFLSNPRTSPIQASLSSSIKLTSSSSSTVENEDFAKYVSLKNENAESDIRVGYPLLFSREDLDSSYAMMVHFRKKETMASRLNMIGCGYYAQYQETGKKTDLEGAISAHQKAVYSASIFHSQLAEYTNDLGTALRDLFFLTGDRPVIDKAIALHLHALTFTKNEDQEMITLLDGLANCFVSRFEGFGALSDLEDAITLRRKAVKLTAESDRNFPPLLNNLGAVLKMRFERTGQLTDLENAISSLQKGVDITQDGHPDKISRMSNLVNALHARFEHQGGLADLEKAISMWETVVDVIPDGHSDKAVILGNLGSALQTRFERDGSPRDLENAIIRSHHAIALTPDGHPYKASWIINLANSFRSRFLLVGSLSDLNQSISLGRIAAESTPNKNPDKSSFLNSLAVALETRFRRTGSLPDMDDAISILQSALDLTPDGHPDNSSRLNNLARSLHSRFERNGSRDDLDQAINFWQSADKLTPDDHPTANSTSAPPMDRFRAARTWARVCTAYSRNPLDAYGCAISLLPRIAWLGIAVTDQHTLLAQVGDIVRDAVAAAIRLNEYELAVEWAEQGRSIVWQNILGLRNPLQELRNSQPQLADQLETISRKLEGSTSYPGVSDMSDTMSMDDIAQKSMELAVEWERIIEEIRKTPNFEAFLKAKKFKELAPAALRGPVIILNVGSSRCDALILSLKDPVVKDVSIINVPLTGFSYEMGKGSFSDMMKLLSLAGVRARSVRKSERIISPMDVNAKFKVVLAELWSHVVEPIMKELAYEAKGSNLPRVWWCATGPLAFLPIHAAGLYDAKETGEKITDYVVSSYTPTLTAILSHPQPNLSSDFQILTVAQPSTPYAPPIPHTEEEVKFIEELVGDLNFVKLTGEDATLERVLRGMKESNWVHLACHGQQCIDEPMKSSLFLHDKTLELAEIVKQSFPKAEFAFLSACQTATGDQKIAEESVHLAAGMFLAGYRGVIATMWSINDSDAPQVAKEVYRHILKDGKPTSQAAAYALHQAVEQLRVSSANFISWVPFIHIGY